MNAMVKVLDGENLENETTKLDAFYESVRVRAAGIDDAGAKQTIVKDLYEKFFSTAFSKTSEKLGIVYTPNEIVDFIIHSVNDVLRDEFDATVSDEGIHVLDPAFMRKSDVSRDIQAPVRLVLGGSSRSLCSPVRTRATTLRRQPAQSLPACARLRQPEGP